MSAWLDPVRRALAADCSPVTFFFRDDDAGWEDDKLYRLLDVVAHVQVPIALAAIPAAIGAHLAAELRALITASTPLVSVHQHGFAHANHEPAGRRSEFGASRSRDVQRQDLANGRERLQQALGLALPPIFTPPWNRCTRDTAGCLVELGFQVLSRDASAEPFGLPRLRELPVSLDWSGRQGAPSGAVRWGETIARAIHAGRANPRNPLDATPKKLHVVAGLQPRRPGGPEGPPLRTGGVSDCDVSRRAPGVANEAEPAGAGRTNPRNPPPDLPDLPALPALGLMLHHAVMTADDLCMLSDLLAVLAQRSNATVRPMFDFAAPPPVSGGIPSCAS